MIAASTPPLGEPPGHGSDRFARARRARQGEVAEDYVELIAELSDSNAARTTEIARRLGVSHVTVVKTIARLTRDGLVVSQQRRAMALTAAGQALAARAKARHEIVWRFLVSIGVDPAIAQGDAEGMEHHASAATLAALARVTRILGGGAAG